MSAVHLHNPTKKSLAESGGLSRSMLYYRPKMPERDWQLKVRIEGVLHAHPSYGHKRIARELGVNRKSALRVMKLFGIKPFRRRAKRPVKARDSGRDAAPYQNLLLAIPFPARAGIAWVSDFTYLKFHGRFVYLATVMDLWSREVVGWSVLNAHTAQLTVTALIDALGKRDAPALTHSDQGNEYRAKAYTRFAGQCGIQVSMSRKARRGRTATRSRSTRSSRLTWATQTGLAASPSWPSPSTCRSCTTTTSASTAH